MYFEKKSFFAASPKVVKFNINFVCLTQKSEHSIVKGSCCQQMFQCEMLKKQILTEDALNFANMLQRLKTEDKYLIFKTNRRMQ